MQQVFAYIHGCNPYLHCKGVDGGGGGQGGRCEYKNVIRMKDLYTPMKSNNS